MIKLETRTLLTIRLLSACIISSLIFTQTVLAKNKVEAEEKTTCTSYLVAEATSGDVLDSLAADQALAPASMTKLMTAYLVLKKIRQGNLSLEDQITISASASKVGGSQVYLKEGEVFSIKELLNALLIQSANDAALALSEFVSGSREAFVEEMNLTAAEIGMKNATFHSPHGLPPAKDQSADLVSANDFLVLSRELIKDYPEILEITKKDTEPFRNGSFGMRNHNSLLRTFEGTDGLKTGYYSQAGFCVTTTAQRKGVRLVAVLMGCPTRQIRDSQAAQIMSKAFNQFKSVQLLKAGEAITNSKIKNGIKTEVALISKDPVNVITKVGSENQIQRKIKPCDTLIAPLKSGQVCGTVQFIRGEQELGSSELLVSEAVAEAGMLKKIMTKFGF